ncbi:MAG: diaminopimelate epimerase [Candidatus Cryptobacteroides sp.]
MDISFYKYQGAGNDFLVADNRDGGLSCRDGVLSCQGGSVAVADLCDRRYGIGADGLMLLESSDGCDFRMVYFNSDGSGGMMCGNGGRCIVAFAADCGLESFRFEAADGVHEAEILSSEGCVKTVRLKMKDVTDVVHYESLTGPSVQSEGLFLDTGTRHFVRFVDSVDDYPVVEHGRDIRYNAAELRPIGANVNFVEPSQGLIKVRTYEKGVEDETFACGTGIVASAIASFIAGVAPTSLHGQRHCYGVKAKRDSLSVDFIPLQDGKSFADVWLTGPATYVARIVFSI